MRVSCFVRSVVLPLSFRFLLVAPGAFSQTFPRTVAEANIPFAFQYSGRTLPAGRYQIRTLQDSFLVVSGATDTAVGLVWRDDPLRAAERAKLVFRSEGTKIVLKDVWIPSLNAHLMCSPARKTKQQEMAHNAAAPPSATITVALMEAPR